MNELVTCEKNEQNSFPVDGRTLWSDLGIESEFRHWMPRKIKLWGFIEGVDFICRSCMTAGNPEPLKEYSLTVEMAATICLVEKG